MALLALGWNDERRRELEALGRPELEPARVTVEHRILYRVLSARGTDSVELSSRLRRQAESLDRPAVGDWVAIHDGRIEAVLPRRSVFVRKAGRERSEAQVVAANIDTVLIVATATRDIDLRLVERYLAAVQQSGAKPVLVLNKIDACESPEPLLPLAELMDSGLPVVCVSALLRQGKESLSRYIGQGTAALVGLSGTGKTSIANWLLGRDDLVTGEVSARDGQGKHTTSHRELYLLPDGGVLIDTPGMRDLGLWMTTAELGSSFPELAQLAQACRFHDCQHATEPGCNVRHAIETGALPLERFQHFQKLKSELTAPSSARAPKPRRR
jgi:ribosome biogenesis GTPase / thiamine phosphate phosphatase